ncbi:MAG: GNAT family N-acetyltransferase [Proteobacteria bacterium]|nr:GNAT family N-acetyltransferase [Pseudomonadota bacterium]
MDVLHTPRLRLRWFTLADAGFVLQLVNDPAWRRYVSDPGVRDEAAARSWMEGRLLAPYGTQGHGFWAVQHRASGALVGLCGLFKRDSLPALDVGYALLPAWRGQGLAQEATAACVAYARDVLGVARLLAVTDVDNAASARVLEACGLRHVDTRVLASVGEPRPTRVFEITWPAPADDDAAIDALVTRCAHALVHHVTALPFFFTPEAAIHLIAADGAVTTTDPRGLMAHLACGDGLAGFQATDLTRSGWRHGALAQRRLHGRSTLALQLLCRDGRWCLTALAWQGPD